MDLIQSIIETKNKAIKRLEDRITQLEKENRELRETLAFEERTKRLWSRYRYYVK